MRTATVLVLALCLVSCKPSTSDSAQVAQAPAMNAALAADLQGMLEAGKLQPAFEPKSQAGKDLKALIGAGEADRQTFAAALEKNGVGAIAQSKLLSTPDGRKRAGAMLLDLSRATIRRYDVDAVLVDKFDAWASANRLPVFESSETLRKRVPAAKNAANETFQHLREWITMLDEIKPGYDEKTNKLTFKGLSKGFEYDKLSAEIDTHAGEWAKRDIEAATALEALLLDLEGLAKG